MTANQPPRYTTAIADRRLTLEALQLINNHGKAFNKHLKQNFRTAPPTRVLIPINRASMS